MAKIRVIKAVYCVFLVKLCALSGLVVKKITTKERSTLRSTKVEICVHPLVRYHLCFYLFW